MEHHSLSLDIPVTLNPYILRIDDTSIYCSTIPVTCPNLLVTAPGYNWSAEIIPSIDYQQDGSWRPFREILTGRDLKLMREDANSYCELPDGIYAIKYSVSPNDLVYVEYNHLRTTKIRNKYNEILCSMDLTDREPTQEKEKKLKMLWWIDTYITAAVSAAEVCHDADKAMELYNYAYKLLGKLSCNRCCML